MKELKSLQQLTNAIERDLATIMHTEIQELVDKVKGAIGKKAIETTQIAESKSKSVGTSSESIRLTIETRKEDFERCKTILKSLR